MDLPPLSLLIVHSPLTPLCSPITVNKPITYTLDSVVSHMWQPKCTWYYGVCSVTMDARYCRFSVACDTMKSVFILLSPPLVWSTPLALPGRCGICMHQHSRNGIRRRMREGHSPHIHIWHNVRVWVNSLMLYINDKMRDIGERNITIKWDLNYEHWFPKVLGY